MHHEIRLPSMHEGLRSSLCSLSPLTWTPRRASGSTSGGQWARHLR